MCQKPNLIIVFCLFSAICISQSALITPFGVTFPAYTTGLRPAANTVDAGTVLYNSTDNLHQYSDGIEWLNFIGTNTIPNGTNGQTLRNNGSAWVADGLLQNKGSLVQIGPDNVNNIGFLSVNGEYRVAISGYSNSSVGVYGKSNTGQGIYGQSDSKEGLFAKSQTGDAIYGESVSGVGVYASSFNNDAVYGRSACCYGGRFKGRVRLEQGGNGDAGIEFEKSDRMQGGYVGMNGNNEMMVWGYDFAAPIQRWNIGTGAICYASSPSICSDIRLKKDFSKLSNSLASIVQLKGHNYYLKNEKSPKLQTGFIAQEIQKIFPELVNIGSDGYLSVDYTGLIPHLVESVKDLKNENEELRNMLIEIKNYLAQSSEPLVAKR